jgi:hypothetical protein
VKGGIMGEKLPIKFSLTITISTEIVRDFFTFRKAAIWDRRLYFPSEGRHAEDCFARKIRRLPPGLNPRTRVILSEYDARFYENKVKDNHSRTGVNRGFIVYGWFSDPRLENRCLLGYESVN